MMSNVKWNIQSRVDWCYHGTNDNSPQYGEVSVYFHVFAQVYTNNQIQTDETKYIF